LDTHLHSSHAAASLIYSHAFYCRSAIIDEAFQDWIKQGLTSHQTHYRSDFGRVLWVKWPNQQCQSTEER